MIIFEIVYILLVLVILISIVLPMIQKDHWAFRAFEFPRLQKLVLNALAIGLGFFLDYNSPHIFIGQILLIAGLMYTTYQIFPFTPLYPKDTKGIKAKNAKDAIRLLVANVYQPNTRYSSIIQRIEAEDPDVIFLVETDEKWTEEMKILEDKYPFKISKPLDNMYGLLFYTRLKVLDHELSFRVKDDIPSIKMLMETPKGRTFRFFGVHPEPPSPTENTYSTDRDAELLTVARDCEKEKVPIIVAGDLNDVAWSYTTERFLRISNLKDPRRGRGIFATFHAKYILLRWPLDHIFCSHHYKLVQMRRLKKIGSDHFPVFVELSLEK